MANRLTNDLRFTLITAASYLANKLKDATNFHGKGGYPSGGDRGMTSIADAMSISNPEVTDAGGKIEILIDMNKAPYVLAFEFGSGVHGRQHQKYPIVARNVPNLIFWWEREGRWFVGEQVMHPGIKERPFIRPTIEKEKENLRKIIGQGFRISLVGIINEELANVK